MSETGISFGSNHQDPLIIMAVPDFSSACANIEVAEDVRTSRIQVAIDCLRSGASILSIGVRGLGAGLASSDMDEWVSFVSRLRTVAPELLIQMDGTLGLHRCSALPSETLAQLDYVDYVQLSPKPDLAAIEISSRASGPCKGSVFAAYDAARLPDQLKLLRKHAIQPCFRLYNAAALEHLEWIVRSGAYMGPVIHCMAARVGDFTGNNPIDWLEYARRAPAGSTVIFQSSLTITPRLTAMSAALGVHIGVAGAAYPSQADGQAPVVQQIQRVVRIAGELGRAVASGDEAKRIMKVGIWHDSVAETLFMLGLLPNRGGDVPSYQA